MRSVRKILTWLRCMDFCTSSARFAPIIVRQPNSPKYTQIVWKAPKHQYRVQWGGSGAFGAKNSDATSFSNFCTNSARIVPRFVWQPNGPKCTQIVRIARKHKFMVQWGGSGLFIAKNSDAISWHELVHYTPVQPIFHRVSCSNKILPNTHKHYETHTNMSLGSHGVDWVRSLRKILMRLHDTNFYINCTS